VVGKKVVAAAKGESAWAIGDGKRTIRQLIEEEINTDPRRGDA
jgi:cyanophycin synthetase